MIEKMIKNCQKKKIETKLSIKTLERRKLLRSGVVVVNFESQQISLLVSI